MASAFAQPAPLPNSSPAASVKSANGGGKPAIVLPGDIWIYELARNVWTRVTFDPAFDGNPIWSADGKQIVFTSSRKGLRDIYQKASDGPGTHYDVTRDGKRFLIDVAGESSSVPIMPTVNWTAELKR